MIHICPFFCPGTIKTIRIHFLEFDPSDSSTSEDTDQDVESDLEKEDDMSGSIRDRISQLQSGHPPTQIHSQPTQHSSAAPVPVPVHGRVSNHSLNSSGHEPENRLSNQSSRSAMSPVQSNFNPVRSQSKTSLHSNDSEPPRNRSNKNFLINKRIRIWDLLNKLQSYSDK